MRTGAGIALAGFLSLAAAPAGAYPTGLAVLQGLDKVTARVSTFEAPVGTTVQFGTLYVTARACDRAPPEEPPESTAFLEIVEIRPGAAETPVFSGWMFASSPALSALEHPVYDVWVLECRAPAAEEGGTDPEPKAPRN